MSDSISCCLNQESFALDGLNPQSTTSIFGTVQIHSESSSFTPPAKTKAHLVGREQIGNTCYIIVNDIYQISNNPDDWQSSSSTNASFDYNLTFSLPVLNSVPTSFQMYDQQENFVCCKIFYTLEIEISSTNQTVTVPIFFHKSKNIKHAIRSITLDEEQIEEEQLPKKLFWGITKQSRQRWQYELEYPHIFDLADCKSGNISMRLRSLNGSRGDMKSDCCLVGCQLIQLIRLEGYQDHIQVLTTATRLLTQPNKSWLKSCRVDFELDETILPTVNSRTLGVEHFMRVTVQFCDEVHDFGCYDLDLQFPVTFTGCTTPKQIPIAKPAFEEVTDQTLVSSPVSLVSSSQTTTCSDTTNVAFSCKSLQKEGEYRLPCFNYPLIAKC